MSKKGAETPLDDTTQLLSPKVPQGVDRRSFLMRSAVGGAAAVMTGCSVTPEQKTAKAVETLPMAAAPSTPPLGAAVKAWTAYAIASNEIASRHRVDFDATVMALAETARDMNSKYKETSEAGLAQSVVLC